MKTSLIMYMKRGNEFNYKLIYTLKVIISG